VTRGAVIAFVAACAGPSWRTPPYDVQFQRAPAPILHARPPKRIHSSHGDAYRQAVVYALARPLRGSRILGSADPLDVNDFGEVVDSPWFENRIGRRRMTPGEVARGPDRIDGPAPGSLTVISGKSSGVTPGFVVRDRSGERFVVKLDAKGYLGLASGAEVISTKLLFAAGYHVPENYVVDLEASRLVLGDGATTKGRYGEEIPLGEPEFDAILDGAFHEGRARAIFSRFIDGKILGPFPFEGVAEGDPNDRLAHERRRSVRGMWIFAAWLDNIDVRPLNTLDAFVPVTPDGLGYVKHYWIDFGTALGSSGGLPKPPAYGRAYAVDWGRIGRRALSLGAYEEPWERGVSMRYASVGPFEPFDPERWVPQNPTPPFDRASPLDRFWAASILARFDEAHIAAAVATARHPEPGAAEHVVAVLRARQLALLRYAFAEVLPLVDPIVRGWTLSMTDLGHDASVEPRSYRIQVRRDRGSDGDGVLLEAVSRRPEVRVPRGEPFVTVSFEEGGRAVEVHLVEVNGSPVPVALTRLAR
jgi:hypothetical protein